MRTFLCVLLFTAFSFAQTIYTDGFNSFLPDTTDARLLSLHILDNINYNRLNDYSPNSNTLAKFGATDSIQFTSPLSSSGYSQYFPGSSATYFQNGNVLGTTNFTVFVWFRSTGGTGSNMRIVSEDAGSSRDFGMLYINSTGKLQGFVFISNSVKIANTNTANTFLDGRWHPFAMVHNGSDLKLYLNGVLDGSVSAIGTVDNDGAPINIGSFQGTLENWKGNIALVAIYNTALTKEELRELYAKPENWITKNSNVCRTSNDFYFTFFDTVGVPLSNFTLPSGKQYRLTVQAKSSDANKNLKCWIGNKSGVREITATSNWSTYTINLGDNFNLGNTDTLWFATNSLADTVSIDNVKLEAVKAGSNKGFGGWLGW